MINIVPDRIKYADYDYINRNSIDKKIKAGQKLNIVDWTNSTPIQKDTKAADYYGFSEDYFNKLIFNHQYTEAANYANKFVFHDPEVQKQHENDIYNLLREGRKTEKLFSTLSKDQIDAIKFYDNYSIFDGIDVLKGNKYVKKFNEIKASLGNVYERTGLFTKKIVDTATDIELIFPEGRIEEFLESNNLDEEDLNSNNINIVRESNGNSTIKFSKTNPLSNKILASKLYTYKGDLLVPSNDIGIRYFNKDGKIINRGYVNRDVDDLRMLVNEAKEVKDKVFSSDINVETVFPSTVGPALDTDLEELNSLHRNELISDSEYKQAIKQHGNLLEQAINTLGTSNFEFYSNAYNGKNTDFTLVKMSDKQRAELLNSLSAVKNSDNIYINSMISNGEIGTLITIKADEADEIQDNENINAVKRRRRMIFIPGLFADIAQEKINSNTSFRAEQELNDMKMYSYNYKTYDGFDIRIDDYGTCFIKTPNSDKYSPRPREEASKLINKDMSIKEGKELKYKYMNSQGKIFDRDRYEREAKLYAIKKANTLFPDIPFEADATIDDVFAKKGIGPVIASEYSRNMQYELEKKYNTVFEIYNELVKEIQAQFD